MKHPQPLDPGGSTPTYHLWSVTPKDADLQRADAVRRAWGEDDKATGKAWIDMLARDSERCQPMDAHAIAPGIVLAEEPAQSCRSPNPPRRS